MVSTIVDRPQFYDFISGANKWFALYRNDGVIDDKTEINDVIRGEFRLHPGSRSEGCVTLKDNDDFNRLRKLLLNTKKEKIPGTNINYYGTIEVR